MDEALRILVAQHHPTSSGNVWFAELRSLGALAIPVMVQTGAQQGMAVTDQVFLGHLGTAEMAAAALANAFTNLMWFFLLGFATALDTLGSHAYGAGDHGALVVSCAAAAVLCSLLVAPLAGGMALGEAAGRVLFGQDQHTAALMGRFCNGLIPGMWPLMWGTVMAKYLQVQNNMLSPSLIAVATFLLNIAFNAALVHRLGFRGAPLATSLSRWAQCGMLAAAVALHERARTRRVRGKPRRQRLLQLQSEEDEALLSSTTSCTPRAETALEVGTIMTHGSLGLSSDGPVRLSVVDTDDRFGLALREGAAGGLTAARASGSCRGSAGSCDAAESVAATGGAAAGGGGRSSAGSLLAGGPLLCVPSSMPRPDPDWRQGLVVADGLVVEGGAEVGAGSDPGTCESGSGGCGRRVFEPLDDGEEERGKKGDGSWWRGALSTCREAMRPRVLGRFLRLGIPGGLSMSFEAGCFDFSTVLAGRLGATPTAAHAAMLSIVTLTYLAGPFALATAGSIRVGNLLGAGEPAGARRAGVLAVSLSGGFMALMALALVACRRVLGYVFTTDTRVVKLIGELAVYAALFQVSDGLMGSSQGVLRGCGHQHLTALFNFAGFWVCGVLLGYLLCFKAGLGLHGLWAGITSGDTATCVLNLVAMSRIRWGQEADKARARIKALAEQAEEQQPMLPGKSGAAVESDVDLAMERCGGEPGWASAAGTSAAAAVTTAVADSSPVAGGGGRSYAGGLKRMWSERRVSEVRRQLQLNRQEQQGFRQDSATAMLLRSLSSFFRRQQQQQQRAGVLAEVQVTAPSGDSQSP